MRILPFLLIVISFATFGQKEKFDIVSYTPPKDWTKELKDNYVSYTFVDNASGTWARIAVYKSMKTLGSLDSDFQHDWTDLVANPLKANNTPEFGNNDEAEGWKIKVGGSKFKFNNADAVALMMTFSGYGVFTSIVSIANNEKYMTDITAFTESIDLTKPNDAKQTVQQSTPVTTTSAISVQGSGSTKSSTSGAGVSANTGFAFHTTNWDDGWVSEVREDFVEVTKGNITVLLHYPKEGTVIPGDPEPVINNAWNILVAPRYSNLRNYKVANTITEYDRGYLSTGELTDKNGKNVYVAFFRRGGTGWMEFVTPDKDTFVRTFNVDPNAIRWDTDSDIWNPLMKMAEYNRFAVATSDFKGKWTSDFSGVMQMYSVYTGNYAGMNVSQSNETFVFTGNSYSWKFLAVNGMVGNLKYSNAESSGTFSVPNNWQLACSKIESKAKTYHAYWSCIKGGRVLYLHDAAYSGGSWTMFGKAKE